MAENKGVYWLKTSVTDPRVVGGVEGGQELGRGEVAEGLVGTDVVVGVFPGQEVIAEAGEGFIAPSSIPTPVGAIRLASPTTTDEYARVLYAALRAADAQGIKTISVLPPDGDGLAIAIRDRLERASRGR